MPSDTSNSEGETADDTVLEPGVSEAVFRFAPHLKHAKTGTVIQDGKKSFIYVDGNKPRESATLVNISNQVIVKYGRNVSLSQVNAMQIVRNSTSMPAPKVLGTYENDNGCRYIVMEYIEGCALSHVWESLTACQKRAFGNQRKQMFDELHSVKGTYIGGVGRLPLESPLFLGAKEKGPYKSEEQMNEALVFRTRSEWGRYGGCPPEAFINSTLPWLPADHEIVLSHGQVHREHILVDMEKEVVTGIVGWSKAGFFPEYWDCILALYGTYSGCDWMPYIHEFLEPYHDEYALWFTIHKRL